MNSFNYDKVILATHADEALKLIENPTEDEKKILSNFSYKENIAYIHTDIRAMPKNKKAWSSWNSSIDDNNLEKNSITYWLNLLQNLKCAKDIFLTLNPYFKIDEDKVLRKVKFTHPYYDQKALDTQSELVKIQNKKDLLFCGSYFGYGFHEDGIKSSIEMLQNLDD
jgi:Predicted NAD/FAD-binding protein